jgi:phosphoribosylaminoimidazole-succinocarboxamide synthase
MRGARLSRRVRLEGLPSERQHLRSPSASRAEAERALARTNLHDQNISFDDMCSITGPSVATTLRERTLSLYRRAAEYAESRSILLADTKFEWGQLPSGEIILIDEVLTPDSSRFWPAADYRPGSNPPSFDKQFVRDWLESSGWDKQSPPPPLPDSVVEKTAEKYREAYERITGKSYHDT